MAGRECQLGHTPHGRAPGMWEGGVAAVGGLGVMEVLGNSELIENLAVYW